MDPTVSLWRRALAEGLAAFALVFAGCGAVVADEHYDGAVARGSTALVCGAGASWLSSPPWRAPARGSGLF